MIDERWLAARSSAERATAIADRRPTESPSSREPRAAPPAWLRWVFAAWQMTDADADDDPPGCRCGGRHPTEPPIPDQGLLAWIAPLTTAAARDLRRVLTQRSATRRLAANPAFSAVDEAPLLTMIKQVLVHELQLDRERHRLCGSTSEDRFGCFVAGLGRPGYGLAVLRRYPVLANELVAHLSAWVTVRAELAARLVADQPLLSQWFGVTVEDIEGAVSLTASGDPHRSGRRVTVVTMPSTTIVYKPRSLALEQLLATITGLLGAGHSGALAPPRTLDRGSYGWSAFVRWQAGDSRAAVDRFYRHMGAHLAVFYVLRCYDLHMYNVIAAGDRPVFIDVETMFHAPAPFEAVDDPHAEAIGLALRESVMATLLLPQPQVDGDDDDVSVFDVSGLGGGLDGRPRTVRTSTGYADEGTDRMRVVPVRRELGQPLNLPYEGAGLPRQRRVATEHVVAGFVDAYRRLMGERPVLLAADGPLCGMRDAEVRSVLRDTNAYTALLENSFQPDLLRDAVDREDFLRGLSGTGGLACHPEIVRSEHRQLIRGDVPIFTVAAGGTSLHDPDGVTHPAFFPVSGLDAVRDRIRQMSETDLDRQVWFIRATLATVGDHRVPKRRLPAGRAVPAEVVVEAARRMADQIVATALPGSSGGPDWLTLAQPGGNATVLGATPLGLATGVTGIAIFLAELDAVVNEPRYRKLAEDVVHGLLDDEPPTLDDVAGMAVGGFEDLGSLALALTRLDQMWGGELLPQVLPWLPDAILSNLDTHRPGDVERGPAGAALALLALHRAAGSPALLPAAAQAARAGRAALAAATPYGLGRGLPGLALAFASVAVATGDDELARVARDAWAASTRSPTPTGSGWRDGSAGTILAGWSMPKTAALGDIEADLMLTTTRLAEQLQGPLAMTDSLGSGLLAAAQAMRAAASATGEARWDEIASRLVSDVARRVVSGAGPRYDAGVWTPGLLAGGAGIGYGLLTAGGLSTGPQILTCFQ